MTEAGWFDDPEVPGHIRYWDGTNWTAHRAPIPPPTGPAVNYTPATVPGEPAITTRANAGATDKGPSQLLIVVALAIAVAIGTIWVVGQSSGTGGTSGNSFPASAADFPITDCHSGVNFSGTQPTWSVTSTFTNHYGVPVYAFVEWGYAIDGTVWATTNNSANPVPPGETVILNRTDWPIENFQGDPTTGSCTIVEVSVFNAN